MRIIKLLKNNKIKIIVIKIINQMKELIFLLKMEKFQKKYLKLYIQKNKQKIKNRKEIFNINRNNMKMQYNYINQEFKCVQQIMII